MIARMVCALFGHLDWVMVMHHPHGRVFMCTRCDKTWPAPRIHPDLIRAYEESENN